MRELSVVIPTYNRAAQLRRLLESLEPVASEVDDLDVVVVDDGSSDDTRAIAAHSRLAVQYLAQANAGPAAARNRGWRAANHDAILFLDDDCVVEPGTLAAAIEALDEHDAVGGAITPMSRHDIFEMYTDLEGLVDHKVVDGEVRYLVTACLAVRRPVLEAAGGFDEGFPSAAGEDADLSMTMIEKGFRLGVSDALRVAHDHRTGFAALVRTYYRHGTAQRLLLAKHPARRGSLGGSARNRLSTREWLAVYRRYRAKASLVHSFVCVLLRALMMVPWLIGARRGPGGTVGQRDDSRVVAMVNDVASVGGGQQVMLDIAEAIRSVGMQPVIVSPKGWLADQAAERGIDWVAMDFGNRRMLTPRLRIPRLTALISRCSDARDLDRVLRSLNASVLHTGALVPHLASVVLRRRGRTVVWHLNQISPPFLFAARLPDRVVAVSKAVLEPGAWRPQLRRRATIIPNAVDLEQFKPADDTRRAEIRWRLGIGEETAMLVTVGRLEPAKGVHVLVEAAGLCESKVTLVVVGDEPPSGDGVYCSQLNSLAREAGCDLRLLGERSDVAEIIAGADLFVFASAWEAFGLVLAEAAACGVPAICGAAGGTCEVVEDGVSGVLVPVDSPADFAVQIRRLLDDDKARGAMARAARELALRRFDKGHYAAAIGREYLTLSRSNLG